MFVQSHLPRSRCNHFDPNHPPASYQTVVSQKQSSKQQRIGREDVTGHIRQLVEPSPRRKRASASQLIDLNTFEQSRLARRATLAAHHQTSSNSVLDTQTNQNRKPVDGGKTSLTGWRSALSVATHHCRACCSLHHIQPIVGLLLDFVAYQLETLLLVTLGAQAALKPAWTGLQDGLARSESPCQAPGPSEGQARHLSRRRESLLGLHLQQPINCPSPPRMLPSPASSANPLKHPLEKHTSLRAEVLQSKLDVVQHSYRSAATFPVRWSAELELVQEPGELGALESRDLVWQPARLRLIGERDGPPSESRLDHRDNFCSRHSRASQSSPADAPLGRASNHLSTGRPLADPLIERAADTSGWLEEGKTRQATRAGSKPASLVERPEMFAGGQELSTSESLPVSLQTMRKRAIGATKLSLSGELTARR